MLYPLHRGTAADITALQEERTLGFALTKWGFLLLTFVAPVILLLLGIQQSVAGLLTAAFVVQFVGLIAERWFFFAQANHPQNLYYQTIS